MGRLYLLVVLLAGCGRLGFDDMTPPGGGSGDGPGTPQLVPQVCAMQSWSTVTAYADADLSVAATPTGATIFSVRTSGGSLRAFQVDASGNLTSAAAGNLIRSGTYTSSGAAYLDNTLIAAVADADIVAVNIVTPDLGAYTDIGDLSGQRVGKVAVFDASGEIVSPTACSSGLTVNPFDATWAPTTAQLTVTTPQTTAFATTAFNDQVLTAWTATDNNCYVRRIIDDATSVGTSGSFPCGSPRLATDGVLSSMMFEQTDGVHLLSIANDTLGANTMFAPAATSPRIVWDGSQSWFSYLSTTGEIVAGTLAPDGTVQSTTLSGVTPQHDAYELAMVGNAPWIYVVDGNGYAGYQLCLAP